MVYNTSDPHTSFSSHEKNSQSVTASLFYKNKRICHYYGVFKVANYTKTDEPQYLPVITALFTSKRHPLQY